MSETHGRWAWHLPRESWLVKTFCFCMVDVTEITCPSSPSLSPPLLSICICLSKHFQLTLGHWVVQKWKPSKMHFSSLFWYWLLTFQSPRCWVSVSLRYRKPERFSEMRLGVKKEKTIFFFSYFPNSHCQFCILPSWHYGFGVLVQYHLGHAYIENSSSGHIIIDSHFSVKIVRNCFRE